MDVRARIQETKNNGLLVECKLLGDGTEGNEFRPEIFDTYNGYYHLDTRQIDYVNKKVKVWVSKIITKPAELTKIRNDATVTIIKETSNGAII